MNIRPAVLGTTTLVVLLSAGAAQSLSGSNTVYSDDIVDDTITSADIKAGQVFGSDIRDGAVKSADVGDNSLKGSDIDESTLDLGIDFASVETPPQNNPGCLDDDNNTSQGSECLSGTLPVSKDGQAIIHVTGTYKASSIADGSSSQLAKGQISLRKFGEIEFASTPDLTVRTINEDVPFSLVASTPLYANEGDREIRLIVEDLDSDFDVTSATMVMYVLP